VLVLLLDGAVFGQDRRPVLAGAQALLQAVEPVAKTEQVCPRGDRLLQHAGGGELGIELVQHPDPGSTVRA